MTHATPASSSTKSYKHQWVAFALMVLILGVAPIWVYPVFLMKVMCFALFACAFNLLLGFGGLLSFGHAMFLGSAGYVSAHAAKVWGWNPELCVLLGTFTSAVLALIVGQLAIRRQGIYFAMITLALAQMIFFFCLQVPFTGGEDGIQAVPRGLLFGAIDLTDNTHMYLFVLVIFLAGFLLFFFLMLYLNLQINLTFLYILPIILLFSVFTFSVGLILGSLNVFFRDVGILWNTLNPALFYLTPIAYNMEIIPQNYAFYFKLNPLYHFLYIIRNVLHEGRAPELHHSIYCLIITGITLLTGTFIYKKTKNGFISNL